LPKIDIFFVSVVIMVLVYCWFFLAVIVVESFAKENTIFCWQKTATPETSGEARFLTYKKSVL
jgi:hypothetical protein